MTLDPGSRKELTIDRDADGGARFVQPRATPPTTEILEAYARREQALREELAILEKRQNRLSNLRLTTGLGMVGSAVWAFIDTSFAPIAALFVLAAAFLFFVYHYRIGSARGLRIEIRAAINAESIDRIHRNWEQLPLWHNAPIAESHPYANDLDIFGHGSLCHLLDTASTRMGETTLQSWLLGPSSPRDIDQRQKAVRE